MLQYERLLPQQLISPFPRTIDLMSSEHLTSSGHAPCYPNQMRDMTAYLGQEWISPDSVCPLDSGPAGGSLTDGPQTQFMASNNPYGSNLNLNTSLPTPISLSNSAYLAPTPSPVANNNQTQELQYPQYVDQMPHHGLGISTPSNMPLAQPVAAGFDQHHHHHHHNQEPVLHNPFSPTLEQQRPRRTKRSIDSAPTPRRRSTPVSIAPNPAGIQQLEAERRVEQEMEASHSGSSSRRRSSAKRRFSQLAAETEFVKGLREQNVPWKEIVERFEAKFGIECSQARLQMRNTRLRQRMQEWAEDDVSTCTTVPRLYRLGRWFLCSMAKLTFMFLLF